MGAYDALGRKAATLKFDSVKAHTESARSADCRWRTTASVAREEQLMAENEELGGQVESKATLFRVSEQKIRDLERELKRLRSQTGVPRTVLPADDPFGSSNTTPDGVDFGNNDASNCRVVLLSDAETMAKAFEVPRLQETANFGYEFHHMLPRKNEQRPMYQRYV
ncbi:hypothetical protein CORC01_10907 [Colletotrichum orchidophilum]|uniref:Uncharacterized protein n=1 Tax=Colletotrichum orchidophilum TaxID=1209926 RepID=A0A1G4AXC1_9PEZI|nr:uncharacterized protein CORC01_10907 [Colletotrichum orchidophilum]OHE93781.1 hypothetical protein CORC01_10907 [Colletotrichum orchidophilum]